MNIVIVGTGYVGLVSGTCFADFGHHVTCVDTDAEKIAALQAGRVPIYEPGLDGLIARNVSAGRLHFTSSLSEALQSRPDAVFIAVGTPSRRGDGHADLGYVYAAAEEIARSACAPTVIVTKSTVPVGTGARVREIVRRVRPELALQTAANPEFLREGAAIEDFKRPDRIVIGVDSPEAEQVLRVLYRPLFLNETPMIVTDIATAEMIKYAANAFLAMKITFINEIAALCEKVGADVRGVSRGIGADRRIGGKFLHPGPGYGGSCFPKDTEALIRTARDAGAPLRLIETVSEVNVACKRAAAEKVLVALGGAEAARGKTVAVWGLTFKPNTDDMRDAPSLSVLPLLLAAGAQVRVHDPVGQPPEGVLRCEDPYEAARGADVLVLLTEWDAYRAPDWERLRSLMRTPSLLDLRNVYRRAEAEAAGFVYRGNGT